MTGPIITRLRQEWRELTGQPAAAGAARGGWWRTASQFVYVVARDFVANRCPVRAAALAYTTLLALVPLLAVAFSVAKNFLHESTAVVVPRLLDKALEYVAPALEYLPVDGESEGPGDLVVSPQARQEAVAKIQQFIGNIDAGTLGVVGSALLIVVAIRLLMTIEDAFNDIWAVRQGRSIWRKVVYYWTTITLGPLLLAVAVALTGTVEFSGVYGRLRLAPGIERFLLHLAPFALLWAAFTLLYALMPNTRVRSRAAFIGGLVGGTLWQLNSLLSTLYVSRVMTYSKIYGGLGVIPIFLAGLYLSWLIVLLGAQVAFATQTFHARRQQVASDRFDQDGRELVACRLMLRVCRSFLQGTNPPNLEEIGQQLEVPLPLLNHLVARLTAGGILSETGDDPRGLLPARAPDSLTLADVLRVLRTSAEGCGAPCAADDRDMVAALLGELRAAAQAAPANLSFKELVARQSATAD